ncbi:hypothetical protein ACIRP2_31595 [Streptomyces sp. NPDC101194]|uniref:hypothetical protein n=1 Tax=Streptomyces sp. NPDC101194 TaxID=3366127 RepID=UPI0037FBF1A0
MTGDTTRDVCPDTGPARPPCGQARAMPDQRAALRGPGTGWDLYTWRRSGLTHPGGQGVCELLLMARSRHRKAENVRRCGKLSPEAIAGLTRLLAPGDRRR